MRPAEFQYAPWRQGQLEKITSGLAYFEGVAADRASTVDIGAIALGCALGYLDFRFSDIDWRSTSPALAKWFAEFGKRESMKQTSPK
jgi:glutathione S-transferase